jgi:hypothetical protein
MARAKGWYSTALPSGSEMVSGQVGTAVIASSLTDATVLRTRAFVGLAHAETNSPPFPPGNSISPYVFRVVITAEDDPPDSGWQFTNQGVDDVLFHPLVWNTGLFVPASLDLTRPDEVYANAYLAGGVVDVKSERHLPGDNNVLISYSIGHAPDAASFADPLFTAQFWIRCLIEATI